jgi:hypothetical protein
MIELLKYGDDCAASAALFREITSLKQNEAGLLMRQLMSGMKEPAAPGGRAPERELK